MIIRCQQCGRTFDDGHAESFHGTHRKFCDTCNKARISEGERKRRYTEKNFRKTVPAAVSVREMSAEADRLGISYGKLVALKMQETRGAKA